MVTSQPKPIVFGRHGLQQSGMDDAGGEISEEMTYWRDVKEDFGGEMGQNENEKLFCGGVTINVCS